MKDVSLYIHIPFCKQKCYYCDFLSFENFDMYIEKYFEALYMEIHQLSKLRDMYNISTIFIGGGTPTYVDNKYIVKLIYLIKNIITVNENVEITIEGNPGTFDKKKLINYKKVGINRLSIGLQCWQDKLLNNIGRVHTQHDFIRSYNEAISAGFKNINIDLIFGLPNQTFKDWKITLRNVCDLKPQHLSCYSLKLENGTKMYNDWKEKKIFIDDSIDREMYYYTKEYLKDRGYVHYEISNFSLPNRQCKHNLVYWELKQYIGIGLGAHSFFEKKRYNNEKKIKKYIEKLLDGKTIIEDIIESDIRSIKEEFIFLGLRKIQGIEDKCYKNMFNISIFDDYKEELSNLKDKGLIHINRDRISLTNQGLDLANLVFMTFINK
ncbi:MAG: radical SAM family heme chaperone HemW [Eubacteriaceae bacterium]